MMQIVLIGIGAGAAAALLFASVTSGSWLSVRAVLSRAAADHDRGHRLEPLGGADRARSVGGARARAPCSAGCSSSRFLPAPALPAWWLGYLAMLARPAGNGAQRAARRMVSARPAGALGGDPRRAGRARRHSEFRHRAAKPSAAQCASRSSAVASRARCGARCALGAAGRGRSQAADRLSGGGDPAGGGGARDHHQPGQSLARRTHREVLRAAGAALAGARRHALPAHGARAAGRRGRAELCRRHCSASSPACCRRAC